MDSDSPDNFISLISYNMHGFSQGILCLDSFCSCNIDIILLQETWLNTVSMFKAIDVYAANYHVFCSSAMDDRLATGVLKGRHFGGLWVMIHNSFCDLFSVVECVYTDANFIIMRFDALLIVNVYLPGSNSVVARDKLRVLLMTLVDCCSQISFKEIVIGGDCNCNILSEDFSAVLINDMFKSINAFHSYNFFR